MVAVQAQGENTGNLPVCEVQGAVLWQKYHTDSMETFKNTFSTLIVLLPLISQYRSFHWAKTVRSNFKCAWHLSFFLFFKIACKSRNPCAQQTPYHSLTKQPTNLQGWKMKPAWKSTNGHLRLAPRVTKSLQSFMLKWLTSAKKLA